MSIAAGLLWALVAAASETGTPCVFEGAELRDQRHELVSCAALAGRSVAVYFAGAWCPLCRRFTPALRAFHERYNDSVSIVFISSDEDQTAAEKHFASEQGDWLALAWDDPLAAKLKRKHRVWSGREVSTFGHDRRSGVPCVVVIDKHGQEEAFLPGERYGAAALREWEPDRASRWPDKSEL